MSQGLVLETREVVRWVQEVARVDCLLLGRPQKGPLSQQQVVQWLPVVVLRCMGFEKLELIRQTVPEVVPVPYLVHVA